MTVTRNLWRAAALVTGAFVAALCGAQGVPDAARSAGAATAAPSPPAAARAGATPGAAPRIGLALSGGGARGIAHVGVLKALDEMRIPIACVTGTSMGAIVGGGFAAGRTPGEMEQLVLDAQWSEIFRDKPPREEIAVRRKIDDYKTLFAPEFGVRDGSILLPTGLLAGVSIESFFRQLTKPALDVSDFDKLPIPFRAMATDIETGHAIALDRGSLAEAMRASMSVPGAMSPVQIDGRLLVDGGIANNLPIDEARSLCGDVIIAVNISTPPLGRDAITSALSVVAQLINFLGKDSVDKQLRSLTASDVLIEPDLGNISAARFERARDAIRIGAEATRALAPKLARYSLSPEQYAAVRARQVVPERALGSVDEIRIEGLERTNAAVVRELVDTQPGEPLSEQKVGADLRRVFGTRDYEGIGYRISGGDAAGPRALVIEPREKSWGPDYLRFGLALASDFQGDNQFNALVQYRRTWLNRLGGEWATEAQIGQNTHLWTEFYQPVTENGQWFVAPNLYLGQQTRGVFQGDNKIAQYLVGAAQAGIDGGVVLGTWGQLRIGPSWTRIYARTDTGAPDLPTVRETTAGVRAAFFADQTNHAWFPTDGWGFLGNAYVATGAMGSAVDYQKIEGAGRVATSWGPHTIAVAFAGGTALGSDMPAYESFTLGGPFRLSAYRINQFSGREYAAGRLSYYRRIYALPDLLGSGVYAGASAEIGWMGDRFDGLPSSGMLYSASGYIGADTFLGPAYLGVGFGAAGAWSLYLLLGAP